MESTEQHTGIRHILNLLGDSRKSYLELCNRVQDMRMKDFLNALSWERIALETALMAEVRRVGIKPAGGNEAGASNRSAAWNEVCEALSNATGSHVLAACARGEGYLLMCYDEALQRGGLDATTRTVLVRQRAQVQGNVNNVKSRNKRESKQASDRASWLA